MNSVQRNLARHALGLPNKARKSYRNHFVTGPGSNDYDDWMSMVGDGVARRRDGSQLTGGDPVFWLTRDGATAALDKGERLDPEDFPATQVPAMTHTAADIASDAGGAP